MPQNYNTAITGKDNALWRSTDGLSTFYEWHVFGNNIDDQITYISCRNNPDVIYVPP